MRVEIVDSRASTRAALRELFESWGWLVVGEAADSNQVLAVTRSTLPDLIVIDPASRNPDASELPTLVEPYGGPVVVGLANFPHDRVARSGRVALKDAPTDHMRRAILDALAKGRPVPAPAPAPRVQGPVAVEAEPEPPAGFLSSLLGAEEDFDFEPEPTEKWSSSVPAAAAAFFAPTQRAPLAVSGATVIPAAELPELPELPARTDERATPVYEPAAALIDPDPQVRRQALQALDGLTTLPQVVLDGALTDPDLGVRVAALRIIGRTAGAQHAPMLAARACAEYEPAARAAAILALVSLLERVSASLDEATLSNVIQAFGFMSAGLISGFGPEIQRAALTLGLPRLLSRLADPSADVARGATVLLNAASAPAMAASDTPAPSAAAKRVNQSTLPTLVEAVVDADTGVRRGAVEALRAMPAEEVASWVINLLEADVPQAGEYLERLAAHVDLGPAARQLSTALLHLAPSSGRSALQALLRDLPSTYAVVDTWMTSAMAVERVAAVRLAIETVQLDAARLDRVLSDPLAEVRLAAVEAVSAGQLGAGRAEALTAVVRTDSSIPVVLAAAKALASAPEHLRMGVVEACLAHRDRQVRLAGTELIPTDIDGSTLMIRLLSDDDVAVVEAAAARLRRSSSAEVLVTMWPALRTASGASVQIMIDTLVEMDAEMTRRLGRNACDSADAMDRVLGLRVLARLGDDTIAGRIERALSDLSREVRVTAVGALTMRPDLVAIETAGRCTRDPEVEVRRLVVQVLSEAPDDRALGFLLDAARDPVPAVREPAREHLLSRRLAPLARMLVSGLFDPARRSVAAELLQSVPEGSTDFVVAALPDADEETRAAMAKVLSSPGAVDALIASLGSPDPDRRRTALRGLALVRDARTAPALTQCLQDPEPEIRQEACTVLGTLGVDLAIPTLRRVLVTDPDMEVVAAAETALRRLTRVDPGDIEMPVHRSVEQTAEPASVTPAELTSNR